MLDVITKIAAIIYIVSFVGIIVGLVCLLPTFARIDLTDYIPKVPLRRTIRGRITIISVKAFVVSMVLLVVLHTIGGNVF